MPTIEKKNSLSALTESCTLLTTKVKNDAKKLNTNLTKLETVLKKIDKSGVGEIAGQTPSPKAEQAQLEAVIKAIQSLLGAHMPTIQEQIKIGTIAAILRAITAFKEELKLDTESTINLKKRVAKIDDTEPQRGL